MTTYGIPYIFEDRTGDVTNTEFDDLYDRMFFGITSPAPSSSASAGATIRMFELGARSSPRALASGHFGRDPAVVLDFGGHGAASADAGTVLFVRQGVSMPIAAWLRVSKTSKGPSRVFRCSDDEDYTWSVSKTPEGLEWSCTTSRGYVAAQYSPRAPGEPAYTSSSGSVLTIYEAYGHIATELLSALTVVRYIHRYSARA